MRSSSEAHGRRRRSYVRQLVVAFLVLAGLLGVAIPLILFWTAWQQARLFSLHTAEELAALLAEDAGYALLVGSRPDAQALVDSLQTFPDLIQAQLLDAAGRGVAESSAARQAPARRTVQVEVPVLAQARDAALSGEPRDREHPLGWVVLTLSLDRASRFALDTAQASLLQLGLLMGVLGVVMVRLSLRMLAPLGTLVRHLGDPLETALPTPPAASPAEVHRLYAAVAAMRERIAQQHRRLRRHAEELEVKVEARTHDLRAARDTAEQANRAKTLFLANVSHELRTPLQAIILHARLLERHTADASSASLAVILRASNQLLALIEQLLHLAKVESGHPIEVTYQSLALGPLLDEVVATLGATLSPRNRLHLELPAAEITLISDRARLTQVLYNLIRNADTFTDGGLITLTLAPDQAGGAIIQVTDQGIGIPPAEQARIFEPFYQGLNGVTGAVSSGIGLGLWLSRGILDALGGRISVHSVPGAGSSFRIELPARPPVSAAPEAASPLTAPESGSAATATPLGQRLLLAEDEDSIRAPLAHFLREAGFRVDECADGTAASALLEPSPSAYAAVILDHRMPGCQGLDLLARLRAGAAPPIPAVILTGDDRAPLQAAITRLGAHLMVKPVLPERLIGTIVTLIESAAPTAPSPRR